MTPTVTRTSVVTRVAAASFWKRVKRAPGRLGAATAVDRDGCGAILARSLGCAGDPNLPSRGDRRADPASGRLQRRRRDAGLIRPSVSRPLGQRRGALRARARPDEPARRVGYRLPVAVRDPVHRHEPDRVRPGANRLPLPRRCAACRQLAGPHGDGGVLRPRNRSRHAGDDRRERVRVGDPRRARHVRRQCRSAARRHLGSGDHHRGAAGPDREDPHDLRGGRLDADGPGRRSGTRLGLADGRGRGRRPVAGSPPTKTRSPRSTRRPWRMRSRRTSRSCSPSQRRSSAPASNAARPSTRSSRSPRRTPT